MRKRPVLSVLMLLLVAGFGACYHKDDYTLTEPRVAAILSLQSVNGTTSLPADNASRLSLVAILSSNADANKRTIVFSTSAGTLFGGSPGTNTGERIVSASADGHAPIDLQSSNQVQTAIVTAKVQNADGVVVTLPIQFVPVTADNVIRFINTPSAAVPADNATITPLTVQVSSLLIGQTVSFTTSLGTPVETSGVPVNVDGTATFHLKSPNTIGSAAVTATINSFSRSTTVQFSRALPNRITVTVSPATLAGTSSTTVTATLTRDVGQVTQDTPVRFSVTDGSSASFFTNMTTSNSSGQATAVFFPGAVTATKVMTVTATAMGADGSDVSGSTFVQVTPQ